MSHTRRREIETREDLIEYLGDFNTSIGIPDTVGFIKRV